VYYLGYSGVLDVQIGDKVLTVSGVSGIKGHHDFKKGYFETYPFDNGTIRSVYHYRAYEVEKLKLFAKL
jgi:lariat debranching enzyme